MPVLSVESAPVSERVEEPAIEEVMKVSRGPRMMRKRRSSMLMLEMPTETEILIETETLI